jgi:hypothetical protein
MKSSGRIGSGWQILRIAIPRFIPIFIKMFTVFALDGEGEHFYICLNTGI